MRFGVDDGLDCGLLEGFQLSVKISLRMGIFEELDNAVVGAFLNSVLLVHNILNVHLSRHD